MTIDEKVEAFRMRLEGNTIQEIANRLVYQSNTFPRSCELRE